MSTGHTEDSIQDFLSFFREEVGKTKDDLSYNLSLVYQTWYFRHKCLTSDYLFCPRIQGLQYHLGSMVEIYEWTSESSVVSPYLKIEQFVDNKTQRTVRPSRLKLIISMFHFCEM